MKSKLIFVASITLCLVILFIYNIEGFETFEESKSIQLVENITNEEIKNIKRDKIESKYDLLKIKYKENDIPYDKNSNVYYISKYGKNYDFNLSYSNGINIKKIIDDDKNIRIIAFNRNKYKIYKVCLTEFPVIHITLEDKSKKNISDNYEYGNIVAFNNKSNINSLEITNESAKFKVRGVSSRNYDKKSYTIQLIDSKTGEKSVVNDFLGLDDNYVFALNSLYEDNSKIRDILSLNLWKIINIGNNNEINIKYTEVFINNEYYGLYGLSEIPNEYKMNVQNTDSIIYKINNDIIPELSSFNTTGRINSNLMEITYSKNIYEGVWDPLKNLIQLIYYSEDDKFNNILNYIDIDNCVNYFILQELTYNADGLWRNSVFTYDNSSKRFIRTPWDFDLTWGAYWDDTQDLLVDYSMLSSNKLLCENGNNNTNVYLEQRLWQNNVGNFRQKVATKWRTLRKELLETELLVNYANELYDQVTESGARERESERWPDGAYSEDNEFIEKFIRQRLEYLDSKFLKY